MILAFAALGAYIGGAAITGTVLGLTGAAIGWSIGAFVGAMLTAPDIHTEGPRITDTKVTGGGYGVGIPIAYACPRVTGNIIWSSDLIETVTEEDVGKGPSYTVTTYSYSVNTAVAVCEGPIGCIRKIWCNGKLVYDVSGTASVDTTIISAGDLTIYLGTESQLPDPYMQTVLGAANVPAYRGLAYVMFENLQLAKFGNRVPKFDFEVTAQGPTYLGWDEYNTTVALSRDLVNWQSTRGPFYGGAVSEEPKQILSNGLDKFVLLTEYSSDLVNYQTRTYTSLDGYNWIPASLGAIPNEPQAYINTYNTDNRDSNDNKFIMVYERVGTDFLVPVSSLDGVTWTTHTKFTTTTNPTDTYQIKQFFWSAILNKYVALGKSFVTNEDQVIWTGTTLDNITEHNRLSNRNFFFENGGLCEFNGKFYIIDSFDPYGADILTIKSSTDLTSYTTEFTFPDSNLDIYSMTIAANSERIVVFYQGWDNVANNVFFASRYSTNGTTWSSRNIIETDDGSGVVSVMTYEGGNFIVTRVFDGQTDVRVWSSRDGINWAAYNPATDTEFIDGIYSIVSYGGACDLTTTPLSTVMIDLAQRVGLTLADLDTSDIAGVNVKGYIVVKQMTVRAAMETLLAAYSVDAYESDGKIKFVRKSAGYVGPAIPEIALGATTGSQGESPKETVLLTRKQELELPNEVVIRYIDRDLNYDVNQQYARRIVSRSDNVFTIDVPVVISADEAIQLANSILYRAWTQRDEYGFSTTHKYKAYEPTDILMIPFGNSNQEVRIIKKEESGVQINWIAVRDDLSLYTQTRTSAGGETVAPGIPTYDTSNLMVFETPVLRDSDDNLQFTVVVGSATGGLWPGCELFIMAKGTTSPLTQINSKVATVTSQAITGTLTANFSPVADPIVDALDTTSTLSVQIPYGTLVSHTEAEVRSGFNTAVVQRSDGTVEVLGFCTATLTSPGNYNLTNLFRRIRQSSNYSGGSAGDKFALLNPNTTELISVQLPDVGSTFEFRAPVFGQPIDSATSIYATLEGMSKKPLSPIEVTGSRDGLDNLTIQWTRRTRVGGSWVTGENGPVSEATEAYEIDILSNASPPVVLRTLTSSTPTVTYTIADQITDFGSPAPATVDVQIYQMSAFIGRGYPAAATV